MSAKFQGSRVLKWSSAAVGLVSAAAGLIQAMIEIERHGGSAVQMSNVILLFIGNISLHAFGLFMGLALLAAWMGVGGSDEARPVATAVVAAIALLGGTYWGISGDFFLGSLPTRIVGGILIAVLAGYSFHLFYPAKSRGADAGGDAAPAGMVPPGVLVGGGTALALLAVIAL
jgi:hypothetical protein